MDNSGMSVNFEDGKLVIKRTKEREIIDLVQSAVRHEKLDLILKVLKNENNLKILQSFDVNEEILKQLILLKNVENKTLCDEILDTFFNLSLTCNFNVHLKYAILVGNEKKVTEILEDYNNNGHSKEPLVTYAISRINLDVRKNLIRILTSEEVCHCLPDYLGRNHLHKFLGLIAKKGDSDLAEIVTLLLKTKIPINDKDNSGRSALHYSVQRLQDLEVTKVLLCNKADPNSQDKDGNTPLHLAIEKKNIDIVKTLTLFSIDYKAVNSEGLTALQLSVRNRFTDISTILIKIMEQPPLEGTSGEG